METLSSASAGPASVRFLRSAPFGVVNDPLERRRSGIIWLNNSKSEEGSSTPLSSLVTYLSATGQLNTNGAGSVSSDLQSILDDIANGNRSSIEVTGHLMTPEHVLELCIALESRERRVAQGQAEPIRELKLTKCGIGNVQLAQILKFLPFGTLKTLSLWWNAIDSKSLPSLLEAISKCSKLSLVDLYGNLRLNTIWQGAVDRLTFHESLSVIGLGGTTVSEQERNQVRERLRLIHSKRTKVLSVLCSAPFNVGKDSKLRVLPVELIRELAQMLF